MPANFAVLICLISIVNLCYCQENPAGNETLIESLNVRTHIQNRFATTVLSCNMKNSGLASSEARLKMNLPANALITGLSTQKDGVKSVGIVKAAQTGSNTEEKEAEQKLITTKPITLNKLKGNLYEFVVHVKPNTSFLFNISYQEILIRNQGSYRHRLNLSSSEVAETFTVSVSISDQSEIGFVKVPKTDVSSCQLSNKQLLKLSDNKEVEVRKIYDPAWRATEVLQRVTREKQLELIGQNTSFSMVVVYDLKRSIEGSQDFVVSDDHFIHTFVAPMQPQVPKNVLFLVDKRLMENKNESLFETSLNRIIEKEIKASDTYEVLLLSNDTIAVHSESSNSNETSSNATVDSVLQKISNNSINNVFVIVENPETLNIDYSNLLTKLNNIKFDAAAYECGDNFEILERLAYKYNGFAKVFHGNFSHKTASVEEFAHDVLGYSIYKDLVEYSNESVEKDTVVISRRPNLCNESEFLAIGQLRHEASICDNGIKTKSLTSTVILSATVSGLGSEGRQNYGKNDTLLCREHCKNSTGFNGKNFVRKCSLTRLRSPTKQPHSDYIEKMAKHLTVVNLIERLRLGDVDQKEKKEISEKILAMSLKCNFLTEHTVMELKDLKTKKPNIDPIKKSIVKNEKLAVQSETIAQVQHHQVQSEHSEPEIQALKDDKSTQNHEKNRQKDESFTADSSKQCYKTLPARFFNVETNYLNRTGPFPSRAECAASCFQNGFCRVAKWNAATQECLLSYQHLLPTCGTQEEAVPTTDSLIMYCITCNPTPNSNVGNSISTNS